MTITIPAPHVPHGPTHVPEHVADADYLLGAVRNIEHLGRGEKLWGSNVTATIIKLLKDAAAALGGGVWVRNRDEADEKQWLDWARGDIVGALVRRGWDMESAKAALPTDEVFRLIRARAVEEVADVYAAGMRSTVKQVELRRFVRDMLPEPVEYYRPTGASS